MLLLLLQSLKQANSLLNGSHALTERFKPLRCIVFDFPLDFSCIYWKGIPITLLQRTAYIGKHIVTKRNIIPQSVCVVYWILCYCNPLPLVKQTQMTNLKWPMSGKPILAGLVFVYLLCVYIFMPVVGQMGLLCSLSLVRCMFCIVQGDRWQVASGHVSFAGFTWSDFKSPAFS